MREKREERFAYLGMPGYGQLTAGAARALWNSRANPKSLHIEYRQGSVLTANFNGLWVSALNLQRSHRPVDYFAMLHADIGTVDGWLDILIEEMEARDLDVLGVAVPIKDTRGLTSLALAHPSGDPWRILCRLSLAEIYRLPETFTSEDVGHKLLLNTGCWVCRFDPSWNKKVHFTNGDRICFDTKLDRYVAQCVSEDWVWSRALHDMGLKIGATRKVPVLHTGDMGFSSTHVWGDDAYDSSWVEKSQLPDAVSDGFRFSHDVPGWLSFDEAHELWRLARGKRVLEIGAFCGRSTVCIAQTAESVTAIDPFDGRATPHQVDTFTEFNKSIGRYGVAGKVTALRGVSGLICPKLASRGERFDMVFIDGAHDADSVRADIKYARRLLAPGGLLAFHDYRSSIDPGVTAAVDELVSRGGELLATHGTLAVVKPPVLQPVEV